MCGWTVDVGRCKVNSSLKLYETMSEVSLRDITHRWVTVITNVLFSRTKVWKWRWWSRVLGVRKIYIYIWVRKMSGRLTNVSQEISDRSTNLSQENPIWSWIDPGRNFLWLQADIRRWVHLKCWRWSNVSGFALNIVTLFNISLLPERTMF